MNKMQELHEQYNEELYQFLCTIYVVIYIFCV